MMLKIKYISLLLSFLFVFTCRLVPSAFALETIPVAGEPIALAVDEGSGRLFSLNFLNKTLSVIDEKKLQVSRTINLEKRVNRNVGTNAVLYDSSRNQLFVSTGGGEVLIFNGSSLELTDEIRIERFIPDLASDGNDLYLLDWSGSIHRYKGDGEDGLINYGEKGSPYMHLGRSNRIYLSSGKRGLIVMDSEKGEVVKKVEIEALSTSAESSEYVFVAGAGRLYVVDIESLEVEKTIALDYGNTGGLGLIHNSLNGYVYVVTEDNTVTIADPRMGKVIRKIDVCQGPRALAVNKKTGVVYVSCPNANTVEIIRD